MTRTRISGGAGEGAGHAPVRRRDGVLVLPALVAALVAAGCAAPAGEPDRAVLAGSATTSEAEPDPEPEIDPGPGNGQTPAGGQPWDGAVTQECGAALGAGFTQVAQSVDPAGTTAFWVRGRDWVVCDVAADVAAGAGAEAVLLPAAPGARSGFDERSLAVGATTLSAGDTDPEAMRVVAGGLLPWRVDALSYTFPDGHIEPARFVSSESRPDQVWWVVAYTATDGPLVAPETGPEDLEPVTVEIVGAAAEAFRVSWEDLQRSE